MASFRGHGIVSGTSLFCNKWNCNCTTEIPEFQSNKWSMNLEHPVCLERFFLTTCVNKSLLWSGDTSIVFLLGIRHPLGNNLHFLAFCVAIKYHYQFSCRSVCVNTVSYPISTFGSSLLQVSVTARCGMDNTLCSPTRTLYTVPGSRERTRRPHETGRCSQWQ